MRIHCGHRWRQVAAKAHGNPATVAKLHGVNCPPQLATIHTEGNDNERIINCQRLEAQVIDALAGEVRWRGGNWRRGIR